MALENHKYSFWRWFFSRAYGRPGCLKVVDLWLLVHAAVGFFLAALIPGSLESVAGTILLPLVGILVGLSFAWAGNAQALLTSREIEDISQYHEGGYADYVFTYQCAVLLLLVALVGWGLAGMGLFDQTWPTSESPTIYGVVRFGLFSLISLAVRTSWEVVLGTQMLLIMRGVFRRKKGPPDENESQE